MRGTREGEERGFSKGRRDTETSTTHANLGQVMISFVVIVNSRALIAARGHGGGGFKCQSFSVVVGTLDLMINSRLHETVSLSTRINS